ncbi:uncharacterized protein [Onthophagus taurus]|uniref:uncharacterized protein n=1 Tax=Onthophagus taurus TaxID=166361 RepID=UPI0039BE684D
MKFLIVVFLCLIVSLALGEHHFKKHHEKKHKLHDDAKDDELNESKRLFGLRKPWWLRPPVCCPCQPPTTGSTSTESTSTSEITPPITDESTSSTTSEATPTI